jgi:hypothetical protein
VDGKAFLAGCVVGAAVGGLGAALTSRGNERFSRAPVRSAAVESQVQNVRDDMGALVRAVEALDARVAKLAAAQEQAATGTGTRPVILRESLGVPEIIRLAEVPTKTDELARMGDEHAENLRRQGTWYAVSHALSQKFLFHSYEHVLRALGRPEHVMPTPAGSTVFTYPLPVRDTQNRFSLQLTFADGMVVKAQATCSGFREGR